MAVHDINNWQRFPYAKKPLGDSTLYHKTKTELIQIIRDYEHNYEVLWQANERGIKAAKEMLPKKGKWETVMLDHERFGVRPKTHYCSECQYISSFRTFFCPNCGADMREK